MARGITAHAKNVAERIRRWLALAGGGARSLEQLCDCFEHAVDARSVARRALDFHDVADILEDCVAVDSVV